MVAKAQLQAIYEQIKAGDKKEAAKQLVPLLRAEPDNASAWWLLANASEDRERQLKALRQLAKLRPDDVKVRAVLAYIEEDPFLDVVRDESDPFANPALTLTQAVRSTWKDRNERDKRLIYLVIAGIISLVVLVFLFSPFLRRIVGNDGAPTPDYSRLALNSLDQYIRYYDDVEGAADYYVLVQEQGNNDYWCFTTSPIELDLHGSGTMIYSHFIFRLDEEDGFAPSIAEATAEVWQERGCLY